MESSERNDTEVPRDKDKPGQPFPGCCGGDFAAFGGERWSPGRFMAGMTSSTSAEAESGVSCPMAKMCGQFMKGGVRGLGLFLLMAATVLLALGAAILLAPPILTWLVGGGLIAAGVLAVVAAFTARRSASME